MSANKRCYECGKKMLYSTEPICPDCQQELAQREERQRAARDARDFKERELLNAGFTAAQIEVLFEIFQEKPL